MFWTTENDAMRLKFISATAGAAAKAMTDVMLHSMRMDMDHSQLVGNTTELGGS